MNTTDKFTYAALGCVASLATFVIAKKLLGEEE